MIPSKTIIVLLTLIAQLITIRADQHDAGYFFEKDFQSSKLKKQLRVIEIRKQDVFEMPLNDCLPHFHDGQIGVRTFELTDQRKSNLISVSEYLFKNATAANKAFSIGFSYAESVRKTPRKLFYTRCYRLPDPQIYFASKKGTHIFLFTVLYNFTYRNGDDSIDSNMRTNNKILLDDLYREFSGK